MYCYIFIGTAFFEVGMWGQSRAGEYCEYGNRFIIDTNEGTTFYTIRMACAMPVVSIIHLRLRHPLHSDELANSQDVFGG